MSETPPGGKPNYGSAIRVAQIIHWLHQYPFGLGLGELAERLGISSRTLARYLQTLKEAFFDDEGEPLVEVIKSGSHGRLRFRRKGTKMEGSAYELMSLYMALDLMAFLDGTFLHEGAQEVLDRLQKTLLREHGNETSLVLKDFHKKFFHWTEAPKDYSGHDEMLEALVKALVLQKKINMVYQSPGNPEKRHQVSPLSLLMYKRALYLVGLRDHQDDPPAKPRQLTFAVERIKSIKLLDEGFFYPADYDPRRRFHGSFGLVKETETQSVRLRFHPRVAHNVASRRWHPSQKLTWLKDGTLEVALSLEIGLELQGWILGYGELVEVLEPGHLRSRIADRLKQAFARYN